MVTAGMYAPYAKIKDGIIRLVLVYDFAIKNDSIEKRIVVCGIRPHERQFSHYEKFFICVFQRKLKAITYIEFIKKNHIISIESDKYPDNFKGIIEANLLSYIKYQKDNGYKECTSSDNFKFDTEVQLQRLLKLMEE